jgi:hypothetical protein
LLIFSVRPASTVLPHSAALALNHLFRIEPAVFGTALGFLADHPLGEKIGKGFVNIEHP